MSNQISLFDGQGPDINEADAFSRMLPCFHDTLEHSNIRTEMLVCSRHKSYSSITLDSVLVMRICFRGSYGYVEVPSTCAQMLPGEMVRLPTKAAGFIRLQIEPASSVTNYGELWSAVLQDAINHIPTDFDCCSTYMECSQEGRCISRNQDLALGCGYKKILQSGRNFYKLPPTKLL